MCVTILGRSRRTNEHVNSLKVSVKHGNYI